jgi:RNA-binding protein 26
MATPNGEIPSVGKVDMAWISTPLPPIVRTTSTGPKTVPVGNADDDSHMEEGDAMVTTSSPAPHVGGEHAGGDQQENLDYDVADDNDWGPE